MIDIDVSKLVDKHFPEIYKHLLNEDKKGNNKIASFKCSRENELRLMQVHHKNAKRSGLNAIGLENLIAGLKENNDAIVFLINIKNKNYFFKLYFDKELHDLLGCVILKLREKTEEELRWGREVLGINNKHPDM